MQAWNLTGDVYSIHPGDKPWISEMYGYSFGAAKADVWHKYHTTAMIYPSYLPMGVLMQLLHLHASQHAACCDATHGAAFVAPVDPCRPVRSSLVQCSVYHRISYFEQNKELQYWLCLHNSNTHTLR